VLTPFLIVSLILDWTPKAKNGRPQRDIKIPLEPSYSIVLENHFHKSPIIARSSYWVASLRKENDDAKISKSPIWVNRKIAGIFRHGKECRFLPKSKI